MLQAGETSSVRFGLVIVTTHLWNCDAIVFPYSIVKLPWATAHKPMLNFNKNPELCQSKFCKSTAQNAGRQLAKGVIERISSEALITLHIPLN
jgi:hypothetical protein